jgi:hypothetical protein
MDGSREWGERGDTIHPIPSFVVVGVEGWGGVGGRDMCWVGYPSVVLLPYRPKMTINNFFIVCGCCRRCCCCCCCLGFVSPPAPPPVRALGGGQWGRHKLFVANARARVEWVSGPSPWSSFYETYIYIYLSIYTVCLI